MEPKCALNEDLGIRKLISNRLCDTHPNKSPAFSRIISHFSSTRLEWGEGGRERENDNMCMCFAGNVLYACQANLSWIHTPFPRQKLLKTPSSYAVNKENPEILPPSQQESSPHTFSCSQ